MDASVPVPQGQGQGAGGCWGGLTHTSYLEQGQGLTPPHPFCHLSGRLGATLPPSPCDHLRSGLCVGGGRLFNHFIEPLLHARTHSTLLPLPGCRQERRAPADTKASG